MKTDKKKIGLVLSGGGSRCFAHLGLLKCFQENNINYDVVVATSSGAFIAALYLSGNSISDIMKELSRFKVRYSFLHPSFSFKALISNKIIKQILVRLNVPTDFKDLSKPLVVTTTNLNSGRSEVHSSGNLHKLILATMAYPGMFKPILYNNSYHADGGLLNNHPADVCRHILKKKGVVLSSNLGDGRIVTKKDLSNIFKIALRSAYIPIVQARAESIKKNSDILLTPFKNIPINSISAFGALNLMSKKKNKYFFDLGYQDTKYNINKIKKVCK